MNGHLKIYDKQGNEVASLVGHTSEIWSIGLDGDRLVSGSDDQTIKMWDLSLLRGAKHSVEYNEELISAIIKATNWTREEVIAGADFIKQKTQLSIYKNNSIVIHPTLSLFVANDDEWVMWTPDGFFDSSPNGAKYIGYHINQGSDKEAQFVSVDRLYNTFYRPDLITKALAGESLASYAKDINIAKLLEGGLAPKVAILTKGGTSSSRDVELNLQVCDNGGGYENLTLLLNGMNIDVIGGDRALKAKTSQKGACFTYSKLISLTSGQNTIGFKATNRTGTIESDTQEITLSYKQAITSKPNLYVLSLAVDKYRDGDLQLKYSVADGDGIIDTLSKVGKNLFGSVNITKLRDKEVTKAGILKAFEDIGAKTTREDVFILHIAGHGITEPKSGEYYYLPVDFRYKNESSVAQQGFSRSDFTQGLSKIQAMKSLSLLDTCNSGSFAEAVASRGILQKTAIDRLTRATGRATIVASSKDQVALEGYKGHGVFTYTLIEALESAGYAGDNQITIKELASYVERILPDRTYEKWGYEQIPQSNITGNDFPIGMK
ncbi:MAG: caspase family protein [Campylobacterales bacterium]|nr:caspase family protein [Campylobacterales bacterium]